MKRIIFLFLILSLVSCSKSIRKNNFYYFSAKAFNQPHLILDNVQPARTTVNGIYYTCECTPKYIKKHYKWDDVVLVAVIPKKAKQEIKYIR